MIAYDPIDHERDSNVILSGVELNSTLQKLICVVGIALTYTYIL
jgi:hypothetical protein